MKLSYLLLVMNYLSIRTDMIILNFSKAVDMLPHKKLLRELDNYWIRGNIWGRVSAFLSHRKLRKCSDILLRRKDNLCIFIEILGDNVDILVSLANMTSETDKENPSISFSCWLPQKTITAQELSTDKHVADTISRCGFLPFKMEILDFKIKSAISCGHNFVKFYWRTQAVWRTYSKLHTTPTY